MFKDEETEASRAVLSSLLKSKMIGLKITGDKLRGPKVVLEKLLEICGNLLHKVIDDMSPFV